MDDPTREAVKLLRSELDQKPHERPLPPTIHATIHRMIERRDELRPIFAKIFDPANVRPSWESDGLIWRPLQVWGWAETCSPEYFADRVTEERRSILFFIRAAASWVHVAKHRRDARRELPDLLTDFGKQARTLARTLSRINQKAEMGAIDLPRWFTKEPLDLLIRAGETSGPASFDLIARHELDAIKERLGGYPRHIPDLQSLLDTLASVSKFELDHATPRLFEFNRERNPLGDYTRTLLGFLTGQNRIAEFLRPINFTAPELLALAAVMTGTDPDELPTDPERGIRAILRERRGG